MAGKRLVFVFILSTLFHFLIGLSLLIFKPRPIENPQPLTIIYQNPAAQPMARPGNRRPRELRADSIPLSALKPKTQTRFQTKEDWTKDTEDNSPHQNPTWIDSQAYGGSGFSSSGSFSKEQVRFISSLWRMIDQYIEENPFLSEYNRTGDVFLRFEVDEQGHLATGGLQASATDRVLKVLATRATRKAIRNETGDVQYPPKRTRIHARFSWSSYQTCQSRRGYNGNYLSFCHYAENKRKTFSTSEETATWAGAIYNHGPWAYEEIQKYKREESRRKSQFNPFTQYELDPDWNL